MFKSIALFALGTLALVAAQDFTISTPPSLVQCQPVLISWSGGTAPYILDVIPGGQTGAAALENLQNAASGTSYSWTVNIASGTSVTLKITDNTGQVQYSSPLTIQAGSSNSCVGASVSGSSGSSASGASASGSASATSGSMTSASASRSSSMAGSSAAASSSAAATTSRASSASATSSGNAASSVSSAAATTSGAAYKRYEVPAAILAAVGGVAALF